MTLRGAVLLALVAAAAVALMPLQANAATEAEKLQNITQALNYLAGQQQAGGNWAYGGGGGYNDVATTGSVLLAFQEAPVAARPANYNAIVNSGLTYLFQQAQVVNIGAQPWGNPDSTGNGIGVYFNHATTRGDHDTYPTGMAIPAIVASGTPGAIVNAPGSAVNGWTYQQVVQETADYLAWGQNEAGGRGGWGYVANDNNTDNSNAQWPAVGLLYAQPWQTAGQQAQLGFVKTELDLWINAIQDLTPLPNNNNGASDYKPGFGWQNPAKTGGLLVQMDYSQGQPPADVNAAVAYLNRAWLNGGFAAFQGNFGDAYAMWGVYKGLEVTIGLNSATLINLHNQLTARGGGPAPLDAGDTWTWWEDYCEYLHNTQLGDGSWISGGFVGGGPLAAAWYTNILNATQIPPSVIPEPVTMIGVLAGIGGLVGYVRRRRLA